MIKTQNCRGTESQKVQIEPADELQQLSVLAEQDKRESETNPN